MAVRIVTALDARSRLKTCAEFLLNAGQEEVLTVSATRMAADELARRLYLAKRGGFGLHRFSAGALAVELASPELALSGKSILAGIGVDALAARAVHDCRTGSELKWFEPVAGTPGFFRALASTLTELRMNDVDKNFNSSGATAVRKRGQPGDPVINDSHNTLRIGGVVLEDAPYRGFEIIGSLGRPADLH